MHTEDDTIAVDPVKLTDHVDPHYLVKLSAKLGDKKPKPSSAAPKKKKKRRRRRQVGTLHAGHGNTGFRPPHLVFRPARPSAR